MAFGSHADSSRCPDVFEHDKSCSCLADSGSDVSVCASLMVNHTSHVDERLHLPYGLSTNCDWCVGICVHLLHMLTPPYWPSGQGVPLESGTPRILAFWIESCQ